MRMGEEEMVPPSQESIGQMCGMFKLAPVRRANQQKDSAAPGPSHTRNSHIKAELLAENGATAMLN